MALEEMTGHNGTRVGFDPAMALALPVADATNRADDGHVVQFYESDAFLVDAVAAFIGAALADDGVGLVFATAAHRAALEARLRASGIDVAAAVAAGRYATCDAGETLARLAIGSEAEATNFAEQIGGAVARAGAAGRIVHVFGELVALLVADGRPEAAVRLERGWNALRRTHPFTLFCAYPIDALIDGPDALLDEICAEHSAVEPAESYASANAAERGRAVAALQLRARRLDREIAARRRADADLAAARAAAAAARRDAAAAVRLRDEFLDIASHELRTPLTTLLGQTQLVLRRLRRDGALQPERDARALGAVAVQAGQLAGVINRLLDVAELEAGARPLARRPLDLTPLVGAVVAAARAANERHVITLTAPPSVRASVDPARFEEALANLLDNAIRHTPEGGSVEVALSRPSPEAAELTVRYRGLGIPPEQKARLFGGSGSEGSGRACGGLGLGLYLCRQIVALHGGDIRVESPPAGGTLVTARLPIDPAVAGPDAASDHAVAKPS